MSDRTLLWRLFEMVKELMPASEANAKRFAEWAAEFHQRDHEPAPVDVATNPQPELDDLMDEPDDDDDMPHVRAAPKRKKR
jgi:hypothetical protein